MESTKKVYVLKECHSTRSDKIVAVTDTHMLAYEMRKEIIDMAPGERTITIHISDFFEGEPTISIPDGYELTVCWQCLGSRFGNPPSSNSDGGFYCEICQKTGVCIAEV